MAACIYTVWIDACVVARGYHTLCADQIVAHKLVSTLYKVRVNSIEPCSDKNPGIFM